MKKCKLVCGHLFDKDFEQEVEIPDGIYFYKTSSIGGGVKIGASHYCTILKTNDYKEWIDYIANSSKLFNWSTDSLGEYTIITINIVYDNKHNLPLKGKLEFLKDIDFHKYVFVYYDKDYRCSNIRRIFDFDCIYELKVGCIQFYDIFNKKKFEGINTTYCELHHLEVEKWDSLYQERKIFEGEEAEILWNSAINKVISHNFNYDVSKVNKEYKFQPVYDEFIQKYGKVRTEYFNEVFQKFRKDL